jgi:hypothetical protein
MKIWHRGTRTGPMSKLNLWRGVSTALLIATAMTVLFLPGCGGNGNGGATVFSIGGNVSGLAGTGLQLQNNGTNTTPVTANGAFALYAPIAKNSSYNVTVFTQPSNPVQVCTVSNGSGIATSNVTNITVACTTTAYTIGGTVSGLTGSGLVLQVTCRSAQTGSSRSRSPSILARHITLRFSRSLRIQRRSAP